MGLTEGGGFAGVSGVDQESCKGAESTEEGSSQASAAHSRLAGQAGPGGAY